MRYYVTGTRGDSFIGGGQSNMHGNVNGSASIFGFIGGGEINCMTGLNNVLGGGQCNTLASSDYSVIAGGRCHHISNNYSSILGGCGNSITHQFAAVFGKGVASAANNTFHVECLNACATPPFFPATYPTGSVMHVLAPAVLGFPAGTCMLLIQ